MSREIVTNSTFVNQLPGSFLIEDPATILPGRRNLRISVTPRCNLHCPHCHNEGQPPPWAERESLEKYEMSIDTIGQLVTTAQHFGIKTVKLTGGDFGMYRHMEDLFSKIVNDWQESMLGISWGANTNGIPLMSPRNLAMVVSSPLTKVTFGIDSFIPGEKSKPDSTVGVESRRLLDSVVIPLKDAWKGQSKKIVIDTVYTGNEPRILSVIEECLKHGLGVNVLEINGVMGTKYDTRQRFMDFIGRVADTFGLDPRYYPFLNQIYLYDNAEVDPDRTKVKFFQDHCADLDCGNCRKIHMRVVPTAEHVCAVPCFLQGQGSFIQLDKDGVIDLDLFRQAISKLSIGPDWQDHVGT